MNILINFIFLIPLFFAVLTTDNLVLEHHGFRQSQTLLQTLYIEYTNNYVDFILPVFGPPWSVPMEYPIYQIVVYYFNKLTELPHIYAGAILSLLSLYISSFVIIKFICKKNYPYLGVFITSPIMLYYSNKYMIDLLSVAFSLVSFLYFIKTYHLPDVKYKFLLILFLSLTGLQKVTVIIPLGIGMIAFLLLSNRNSMKVFILKNFSVLISIAIPLIISIIWVLYSDSIKLNNYLTSYLTSSELREDTFGSISYRFVLKNQLEFFGKLLLLTGILPILLLSILKVVKYKFDPLSISLFIIGLSSPFIFFKLHVVHDYYYIMSSAYLLVGFLRSIRIDKKNYIKALFFIVLSNLTLMLAIYNQKFVGIADTHNDFYESSIYLGKITEYNDVVISIGADWDSTLPLYSGRKFIMIPEWSNLNYSSSKISKLIKEIDADDFGGILLCVSRLNPMHKSNVILFVEEYHNRIKKFNDCYVLGNPTSHDISRFLKILI